MRNQVLPLHDFRVTGGLSESTALAALLIRPEDNEVETGACCWSEEEPWPPLSHVLSTNFWRDQLYKPLWDMLRTPVTTPQLVIEDDFATIDPVAPQPGPEEPAVPGLHRMQSSTGLIHVTGMKAGSRVPQRLLDLQYQVVLIEVQAEDSSRGVHSLAVQCLNHHEDVVVVVVGDPQVVSHGVVDRMDRDLTCRDVVMHQVLAYVTFDEDPRAAADVLEMRILSRKPLSWQVCPLF